MSTVADNFLKMFRGGTGGNGSHRDAQHRAQRHSTALNEFMRAIAHEESLCILDLGPTSANNIALLTDRGFQVYTEDLLTSAADPELMIKDELGNTTIDIDRFLKENLAFRGQKFDAVLLWDVADYLPEVLVKPVIERICSVMKPKGILLSFFHTRDAGPEAPYCRYHIAGQDSLELQLVPKVETNGATEERHYRLQRVFNNRHIENLFREFASLKFFLARDNLREVLVVR
ncbi:MAG TPA: methyltransferase domain-containing protein [Terriglobales bacterium]|nr:methyltransferase domain-containing protein [Terriglobales bacterium]